MKISLELSDRDLIFFRKALKHSRNAVAHAEESEILEAIRDVLDEIRAAEPLPDFVAHRIPEIEALIEMLTDDEWQLPNDDRERLLAMFIYFGDPEDILPDDIPVIGYLDDVIVIELIMHELKHERQAYTDFCEFRTDFDKTNKGMDNAVRRDRIDRRRQQLHQRMKRRSAKVKSASLW